MAERLSQKQMLEMLIERYAGGTKQRFADMCGVTRPCVSGWLARGVFDPIAVYRGCPGVSARWLLTGEGRMEASAESMSVVAALIDRIQSLSEQIALLKGRK